MSKHIGTKLALELGSAAICGAKTGFKTREPGQSALRIGWFGNLTRHALGYVFDTLYFTKLFASIESTCPRAKILQLV